MILQLLTADILTYWFHSSFEMTLTYNMAFLDILMHLFLKKYITSMSGMLFLMFVQGLFQFGVKEGKCEGYYEEKNYLDMSFK